MPLTRTLPTPLESPPAIQDVVHLGAESARPQLRGREFPDRLGYDANFLGIALPLPQLDASIRESAAPLLADPTQTELKYTHFSVVQNKDRATPFFSAVNIDGAQYNEVKRKGDFALDSRIAAEYQTGKRDYKNSGFDRGHLTRRKETTWGPDAEQASRDSLVYTNAGPQHPSLNQKSWLDLENNILFGAVANGEKKTVFTGPVFQEDDPVLSNQGIVPTRIPQSYWKVQVWNDEDKGGLQAEAFLLSQKEHLKPSYNSGWVPYEQITPMKMQTFRISMTALEQLTNIHFGNLSEGEDRTERDAQAIVDAGIDLTPPSYEGKKAASQALPDTRT